MRPLLFGLLGLGSLLGCTASHLTRVGEHFAAREPGCALDFRFGDLGKALLLSQQGYVQVAVLSVGGLRPEYSDEMKARLRAELCPVGAELVLMISSNEGNIHFAPSADFSAFRKIQPPP